MELEEQYKGWTIGINPITSKYRITDPAGKQFDSCSGFYDDTETIVKDCQDIIDHEIVKRAFDIERINIKTGIVTEGPR